MLFSLVISLFPLAVYLFFLAGINRRDRPLLMEGVWETAALLFGLCGFFLFAIPELLNELYLRELSNVPLDEEIAAPFERTYQKWRLIWVVYYSLVLILAAALVFSRHNERGIYNVDLVEFRKALSRSVEGLGLTARSHANTLFLFPDFLAAAAETGQAAPLGELSFDVFPALCHVTLRWHSGEADLRRGFEAVLIKNLEDAGATDNPSANWFLGIASLLFGALFMLMAMWLFNYFFPRAAG